MGDVTAQPRRAVILLGRWGICYNAESCRLSELSLYFIWWRNSTIASSCLQGSARQRNCTELHNRTLLAVFCVFRNTVCSRVSCAASTRMLAFWTPVCAVGWLCVALLRELCRVNSVVVRIFRYCLPFNEMVNVHFVSILMNILHCGRPLIAETWGQWQASPPVVCGGQSSTGHSSVRRSHQTGE
jgi:hypothetical protein